MSGTKHLMAALKLLPDTGTKIITIGITSKENAKASVNVSHVSLAFPSTDKQPAMNPL